MSEPLRRSALLAAACVAATGLHLAYSPYGYPLVDESMIHAMSRRLLSGQVPHRDFIFSRTALTPLLLAPLVALESEHLMLWSRLWWWVQMTTIAFVWTAILGRHYVALRDLGIQVPLSILALMLSVHTFPPMVWYTSDGVFFASLGYWMLQRDSTRVAAWGGVVLGLAVLCKQNFAVIPLLVLVVERRLWAMLAGIPVAAYFGFLALAGGMPDFLLQQRGHSDFLTSAVWAYAHWPVTGDPVLFVWLGLTATLALQNRSTAVRAWGRRAAQATMAASLAAWAWLPAQHNGRSMTVFWAVAVYAVALAPTSPIGWRGAVVPVGVAWASSISNGWPSRALGSAPLAALAGAIWLGTDGRAFAAASERRLRSLLLCLLALVSITGHHRTRVAETYCDRPRKELIHDLGPVLPGWSGIYTSQRTFDYIVEAESLSRQFGATGVAVIPDFPGHWVPAGRVNPLPIDWAYWFDLPLPELVERVVKSIDSRRGRIAVLVGRDNVTYFDREARVPYRTGKNRVVDHVSAHWTIVHRGTYFDVYR